MGRASNFLILAALLPLLNPAAASAQQPLFGVGGSVAIVGAPDEFVRGVPRVSPLIRFGENKSGWGTRLGLSWYGVDLDQPIGRTVAEAGRIRVRPLMAGYGYTRIVGPLAISGNLLAGYAFTSFRATDAFRNAYRADTGADRVSTHISNEWVAKPEVSTWLDVSRKLGVNISLGYVVARPTVRFASDLGREERDVRADVWMFRVGAAYSIF